MTFLSCNTVCLSLPEAFLSIWVSTRFFPFVWERLGTELQLLRDDGRRAEGVRHGGTNYILHLSGKTSKFQ